MKKGLLIFDCDGVVREFSMLQIYSLHMMICEKFNLDHKLFFTSLDTFKKWYSHDWKYNLRRMKIVSEGDVQKVGLMFVQEYEPHINIFPWVEEYFAALSRRRHIAICSNSSTQSIKRTLNGVLRYVDMVVGYDGMPRLKPHPDGLQIIMQKLGYEPKDTAFFGDAAPDIQAGISAGVFTGAVAWGATEKHEELVALGAHMILHEPEDFSRML